MTFEDPRSVVNAMDMGPHFIDGCRVDAKRSTRRQPVAPPSEDAESTKRKIFVGGLPKAVGEFELKQYFSRFGNVLGAIHVTEKGSDTRRGFGFVEFDEQAAVDRATGRITPRTSSEFSIVTFRPIIRFQITMKC